MKYECGYTIRSGGETMEVVVVTVDETDKERMEREIRTANAIEAGPNVRGLVKPQTTFHWIRPQKS